MLEISKDKIIDLSSISLKKVVSIALLTTTISTFLFSGSAYAEEVDKENINTVNSDQSTVRMIDNDETYFIPFYITELDNDFLTDYEEVNLGKNVTANTLLNYRGPVNVRLSNLGTNYNQHYYFTYLQNASEVNVILDVYFINNEKLEKKKAVLDYYFDQVDNYTVNYKYENDESDKDFCDIITNLTNENQIVLNYTVELNNENDIEKYYQLINKFYNDNIKLNLNIVINNKFEFNKISKILEHVNDLSISFGLGEVLELDDNAFDFLGNSPDLNNIIIAFDNYETNYDLTLLDKYNLKNLHFNFDMHQAFDMNFKKLANIKSLKSITFSNILGYYDIVTYLDNETLDKFKQNGVELINLEENKVREANTQIDSILKSLGVNKESTDYEKHNAILAYLLENYHYDENISNMLSNTYGSVTEAEKIDYSMISKKYEFGKLTAALTDNSNIICGNYAALYETLANRLELDSIYVGSRVHAWNIVKLEDEYYYTDATWLDSNNNNFYVELLKNNDTTNLEEICWYKYDLEKAINEGLDSAHKISYLPYVEIDIDETIYEEYEELINSQEKGVHLISAIDITNTSYLVTHNNKKYVVPAAVLLGILCGSGLARNVTKYVKEKENDLTK